MAPVGAVGSVELSRDDQPLSGWYGSLMNTEWPVMDMQLPELCGAAHQ